MKRTKLADRRLPDYTRGEEIFNMVTHIIGAAFGIVAIVLCLVFSAIRGNVRGAVSGAIYGSMTVALYTVSSVYHGLSPNHSRAKKVMQVLDHCTIYALIAGSYMPVLMTGLWDEAPVLSAVLGCVVLTGTAIGVTFTAIDFHKYRILSNGCYFLIGWCVIFALPALLRAYPPAFFLWLLAGGLAFTFGSIFYATGRTKRYHHSVFHLFILLGSALQFVAIFKYCILR